MISAPVPEQPPAEHTEATIRAEAADAERRKWIAVIKTELLWKNQDEGFIGGLQWMLDKLEGKGRL